jgi:serine protease AprX
MKLSARTLVVLVTTLLVSAVVALPATAGDSRRHSKLDKVLQEALAHPPKTSRVIIRTAAGTTDALKRTLVGHGDAIEREHASLDAFTATVHGEDLAALAADPSVLNISIDAWVTSFGRPSSSGVQPAPSDVLRTTLGINNTTVTGSGVNVAIVDSGIDPNRDLFWNIRGFWDFTRGGYQTRAYDDYGHGTHVAGLIASNGRESGKQFMGIAPNVGLYGFKVLDKYGRGRTSDVVAALEFIVNSKIRGTLDIDVINLSLGHPIFEPAATDPLVQEVERAVRNGIVVVTAAGNVGVDAAGNIGYSGVTSPGNAPSAISVGAVDTHATAIHSDDRVAYFSSRGPTWFDAFVKPDIVAPGVALTSNAPRYSQLYANYPQLKATASNGNTNFATLSGTSMAAAVATGVVALALDANTPAFMDGYWKSLSPNAVKAVLQYTALPVKTDTGAPYDVLTQGTGEVNAPGAIAMAAAIDPYAAKGTSWGTPIAPRTTIGGEVVAWSQALVWDENIVWGTNVVWSNSVLWDENIVWGTTDDENIVWGTNASCDPANPDCENIVWGTSFCDPSVDPGCENIVWGTYLACDPSVDPTCENIVWGTNIVWATTIVWGNRVVGLMDDENIVWGTADGLTDENIVWGTTSDGENIVWGTFINGAFTWGTAAAAGENIVWGTTTACDPSIDPTCENIVWGTGLQPNGGDGENIVWGTRRRR